jgi:hypothetical protein
MALLPRAPYRASRFVGKQTAAAELGGCEGRMPSAVHYKIAL